MAITNTPRGVRPFQLYNGQWHSGLTRVPHLETMFRKMPNYTSDLVEKMWESNIENDIISYVNQFSVHKTKDPTYRWLGIGMTDKNVPLKAAWEDAAGTIPVGTSSAFIGANGNMFYMDFNEKWFGSQEHIAGMKPDLYRLWIVDEPNLIGGSVWRYRVQLTGSEGSYIPSSELAIGTRWSKDGGLVSDDFSRDGYGISFTSPFEFENRMSQFRMQIKLPGSTYREGKYNSDIYMFQFYDDDGNPHKVWFESYWLNFLKQTRLGKCRKFLYDKNNKRSDGSTGNVDPRTNEIATEGSGLMELMNAGNIHPYNPGGLTVDYITKAILDMSVTKIPQDKREITIMAGEYGLVELHKMLRKELIGVSTLPAYMGDTTGRAYVWNGNDVNVNLGQIVGFASLNGVKVKFMHAPFKDDPIRNKLMYNSGIGGRVGSHEFDILDFGTTNGRPNIQRVELEGQPDIYAVIAGLRSNFTGTGSEKSPVAVNTATDMDELHFMGWQGSIIWNPTKVIRLIPSILYQ